VLVRHGRRESAYASEHPGVETLASLGIRSGLGDLRSTVLPASAVVSGPTTSTISQLPTTVPE
jgi:hypothetical protein